MKRILPLPLALIAAGCILEPAIEDSPSPKAPRRVERPAPVEAPVLREWPQVKRVEETHEEPTATPEPVPAEPAQPFHWPAKGFPKRTPKGNHFIGPVQ